MDLYGFKEKKLSAVLPKELRDSLTCFTFVNYDVVGGAPDITICSTDRYLNEVKNKKIKRTLHLTDDPVSILCSYLLENEKLFVFYLVLTKNNKLLIVRLIHKRLKIVAEYYKVKEFQVFDFKSLGFPQIKITFLSESECSIFEFPVERLVKLEDSGDENPLVNTLVDELEELKGLTDELTEEYNHLRKMCFSSCKPAGTEKILVGPISFSSLSIKDDQEKLMVCWKWVKVFGNQLVLGMKLRNIGSEIINGMEVIISQKKTNDYVYGLFQSSNEASCYLFSPLEVDRSVRPGTEVTVVATFEVPTFFANSDLTIPCFVIGEGFNNCLVQEIFEVNVSDIASQSIVGLEERFTVEDLLAMKIVKSEARVRIKTEDLEDGFLESFLMGKLGFKMIMRMKEKLFYCTASYLKEVFVALEHIAVNPSVWKMILYTSDQNQVYFIINALYDILPDNTIILCDENNIS